MRVKKACRLQRQCHLPTYFVTFSPTNSGRADALRTRSSRSSRSRRRGAAGSCLGSAYAGDRRTAAPLPHAAHAGGRDRVAALADLVGDLDLAEGGLLKRQSKDQRLNLGRRAVGQKRLAPRQLLKRQLASGLVEILEAIEAVARVAHHLAGLAHVAELPGELQQAKLGPDDLLFLGHDQCPLERRGRALRTPTTPRPASAHASA